MFSSEAISIPMLQISALPPWALDERKAILAQYLIRVDQLPPGGTEPDFKLFFGVIEKTFYSTSEDLIYINQRSQFRISTASLRALSISGNEQPVTPAKYIISVSSYNASLNLFQVIAIDHYD